MSQKHSSETAPFVRRYDYPDHTTIVADLGSNSEPTIDLVGETAIIVTDETQHEIELPDSIGNVEAINKNGIITITIHQ